VHKIQCRELDLQARKQRLASAMLDFAVQTIVGAERAFFRRALPVRSAAMQPIAVEGLIFYMNLAHRALCLHDDAHLERVFRRMRDCLAHSYVCLLNLVARLTKRLQEGLNRERLAVDSLEAYSASVEAQLRAAADARRSALEAEISHTCSGDELDPYDPQRPMFFGRATPLE
jgi:hypothetical protein